MELFTEVEFNKNEFDKIDEVRFKLGEDGWEEINKTEHRVIKSNKDVVVGAVKYKWRRII
ncbi:hypothetical protein Phi13:2_gp024 [Cellulophaga phage phi13:2]|uniref:Uncharacterized protein n=1 Tax=Cellulophaga phage phi13:2 TaxID=1328030 RepID=S0A235_9CAUD|nr:hypothetical protein Phi13:2_gp024 [Cellulophaga phage phi13:2]AGO49634.1 hypothetical protein Phi13:2_gp024 [Cellulophaga phage phi13:2]